MLGSFKNDFYLNENVKLFKVADWGEARIQEKTCNTVLCSVQKNVPPKEMF